MEKIFFFLSVWTAPNGEKEKGDTYTFTLLLSGFNLGVKVNTNKGNRPKVAPNRGHKLTGSRMCTRLVMFDNCIEKVYSIFAYYYILSFLIFNTLFFLLKLHMFSSHGGSWEHKCGWLLNLRTIKASTLSYNSWTQQKHWHKIIS